MQVSILYAGRVEAGFGIKSLKTPLSDKVRLLNSYRFRNGVSTDNRACKGQISRIFASLFPNYGRKSYDYGEISTLLWGEQPANT